MKLDEVRKTFNNLGIDGFIISNTDKFFSSFVADADKRTEFMTGFSEDRAILVILAKKAALFVSARDFKQAKTQINDKRIEIYEMPSVLPVEWIIKNSEKGDVIGYDAWLFDCVSADRINEKLTNAGIKFKACENAIDLIWKNKPLHAYNPIIPYDIKYAGQSSEKKLVKIRNEMKKQGAEYLLLSSLDNVAWLFNLRGSDIPENPFFYSYALIGVDSVAIYCGSKFSMSGVKIKHLDDFEADLKKIKSSKIMLDKSKTAKAITLLLKNIIDEKDPCKNLKAIKNKTELKGMEIANFKDSLVVVKLFAWLSLQKDKKLVTELDIVNKIEEIREIIPDYKGKSFTTICGVDENSGIIHYNPTKKTNKALDGKIMLLDTGAHYIEGTTDMTRTISLDKKPTKNQKETYTLVLKGHLALRRTKLKKGDFADKLDKNARKFILKNGYDYPHSTGHGVGCYLCVHEDPPFVSKGIKEPIKNGMVFSNEPGCYYDEFGVRIENVVKTEKSGDTISIQDLTLIPYDLTLIDKSMLTPTELKQINSYHKKIKETLIFSLNDYETIWLNKACKTV